MTAAAQKQTVQLGLGEAIERLINLHTRVSVGIASEMEKAERHMILKALNSIPLDVGFDCNNDGVPDTIEIFRQSTTTSCCRLVESDTSRRKTPTTSRRTSRRKRR